MNDTPIAGNEITGEGMNGSLFITHGLDSLTINEEEEVVPDAYPETVIEQTPTNSRR